MDKPKDFLVDTKGHCFLCLSKISSSGSVYSFQHISHYLKINRRNVFDEKLPVPINLLKKVEKSLLKVSLCDICGPLTDKVSDKIQQLERIRMEVDYGVRNVKDKLIGALESGEEGAFKGAAVGNSIELEKINIVQRLRRETVYKCSKNLERALPRVSLLLPSRDAINQQRKRKFNGERYVDPSRVLAVELNVPKPPKIPNQIQNKTGYNFVPLNHVTDEKEFHGNYINKRLRFACDVCNAAFAQRNNLRLHLLNCHPQRYQEYQAERQVEADAVKKEAEIPIATDNTDGWNEGPIVVTTPNAITISSLAKKKKVSGASMKCRKCNKLFKSSIALWKHEGSVHLKVFRPFGRRPKQEVDKDEPVKLSKEEKQRIREERIKRREGRDKYFYYENKADKTEVDKNYSCDKCTSKFRTELGRRRHDEVVHLKLYAPGNPWLKRKRQLKQKWKTEGHVKTETVDGVVPEDPGKSGEEATENNGEEINDAESDINSNTSNFI